MKNPIGNLLFGPLTVILSFTILNALPLQTRAQVSLSADDLFQQARHSAFSDHDYPAAIERCKKALEKSPDYSDIRVFLGRIYAWNHHLDSARQALGYVLDRHPDNEDAAAAMTDLEYWNDHSDQALSWCDKGLFYHPASRDLLLKKAKILNDLGRFKESAAITDTLLRTDPKNAEARALALQTRFKAAKNQLGVYYDYVYFDKEFNAPWHLASVDYKRQTKIGAVIGRINYANRFNSNGVQVEGDAYPKISRTFYSYINAGYSHDVGIFPKYRAGFSLYANLPKSFEAEAGFRYLYFSSDTWIYTLSAGKYYRNFWFNARTYLTPGNSNISQSYTVTTRYYYGGADDYLSLALGTGISPDDLSNNIQLNSHYELKSNKLSVGYNHAIKKLNVVFATATLINQEYLPGTRGNQVDIGIGYQKRF
ncbi:MAG: YaiO family outer membrane beta-barrel protein [Puia sp.]|nr:YaiO family outer membrane beta-barrel protein [Puia sp.]